MLRLFSTKITFLWNLAVIYMYHLYYRVTTQNHIQEPVVLFDNVHTVGNHTIIDFTFGTETKSVVIQNPPKDTLWNILSIYDNDHKKDLTRQFKQFANQYDPQTHTFQHQEAIKQYFNTSSNIVIIDEHLEEFKL